MMNWEYITVALDKHYPDTLNGYGQLGWELVSVIRDGGGAFSQLVAFFKRPLDKDGPGDA